MKKLTGNLVQQRLKSCTTDLDKILQINVTGRELEDVSLLSTMTKVEILSLSVNHISRLCDFQFCKNLKELYLRNNKISDLSEIAYLKNLPKLRLLMLSENPCCEDPLYRMTVIRNLKHLTELDKVPITLEERKQAQKLGVEYEFDPTENDTTDDFQEESNKLNTCEPAEELIKTGYTKPIEQDELSVSQNQTSGKNAKEQSVQYVEQSHLTIENTEKAERYQHNKHPEQIMSNLKKTNILSAILSLIKELDYIGLQLINAEICSRLNIFEADLLFQEQKFKLRGRE